MLRAALPRRCLLPRKRSPVIQADQWCTGRSLPASRTTSGSCCTRLGILIAGRCLCTSCIRDHCLYTTRTRRQMGPSTGILRTLVRQGTLGCGRFLPAPAQASRTSPRSSLFARSYHTFCIPDRFRRTSRTRHHTCPSRHPSQKPTARSLHCVGDPGIPGRSVRGERANFTRLVLGCIEAKFCIYLLV